jgi:Cd2+/Zn2+-exporting ATPase
VPHESVIKEAEKEGVTAKPMGAKEDDEPKPFLQAHKDSVITGLSALLFLAGLIFGFTGFETLEIPLYALSIIIGGFKTARSALYGLKKLNFDMNVLMTIAVVGAVAIGE